MTPVGRIQKKTHVRVVAFFREHLGCGYQGNRIDRDNRNLEEARLSKVSKEA